MPLAPTLVTLAFAFAPAIAFANLDCLVADSPNDRNTEPGRGFDGAAYQDIVSTAISREGDAYVLRMEVAEPIPNAPALRTPNGLLLWMWGINADPAVPLGFPLGKGVAGLLDFWIHLAWDGESFDAIVIDRRPTLQKQAPVVTPVDFDVTGTTLTIRVPSSVLGDLASFTWGSSTWIWPTHLGTTGAHRVDQAPDIGGSPCAAT